MVRINGSYSRDGQKTIISDDLTLTRRNSFKHVTTVSIHYWKSYFPPIKLVKMELILTITVLEMIF